MSKNSKSINIIKSKLDNVSGLDGQVGNITESLISIVNSIEQSKRINYKDLKKFKRECEKYNYQIKI